MFGIQIFGLDLVVMHVSFGNRRWMMMSVPWYGTCLAAFHDVGWTFMYIDVILDLNIPFRADVPEMNEICRSVSEKYCDSFVIHET